MTDKQIWRLAYFGFVLLAIGSGFIADPGYKIGIGICIGGIGAIICALIHALNYEDTKSRD